MADLIGRTLKRRYRIEAGLGRGGMAEVYRAFDTRRHYPVAVKVLREDLAEDWDFVRRFQAEAESLARLAHQNIVRFYSFEQDGRIALIVMDYIEGDTLRGRLFEAQGRPMAPAETLPILRQVAAALAYAHAEGIIHRDVKPGNIMLKPDGTVLLSDFGIAKAVDAATVTAAMPGTPAYMSPEQCRGDRVDARTDVYSLGVVLYEMLAGRRPFVGQLAPDTVTGGTHERVRWEQMHATPPDSRSANPALTRSIAQVVMQALEKDPDQRYPTVMAFLQAFEAACSPHPLARPEPPPRLAAPPRIARTTGSDNKEPANGTGGDEKHKLRALLLALGVVAAAVVIIGVALWLGRGGVQRLAVLAASAPSATPSKTSVADLAAMPGATPLLVVAAETPSPLAANNTATPIPATVDTAVRTVTPADTPTHTATSTPTPTSTAIRAPTHTATSTSTATQTATVTPSWTPSPVLTFTPTPTRTPLPTPPSPTPLPDTPPPVSLPAPTLVSPTSGSAASGQTSFAWNWNGPALTANQGFEVRLWRDGQPDHYGAAGIVQGATSKEIDVWTAYGVQQGGSGSYYWTVAVVEISPYRRTGPEAPPRPLQVGEAGGGGDGGPLTVTPPPP